MGELLLGIEGGGTKTVALTSTGERRQFGPLNLQLVTDRDVLAVLRSFRPSRAAVCLAGCRTATDRDRLRGLCARAWPSVPVFVGSDLDSGHAAAFGPDGDGILVLSGTGSVVFGRHAGQTARAGGWGHLLGDHGSGYWLALTGLRAAIREFDRRGIVTPALQRVLGRLCLNSPDELVAWIQQASKDEVAGLVGEVLESDFGLMTQGVSFLAQDCYAVAGRLGWTTPRVALAGGVLVHQLRFAWLLKRRLRAMMPGARVFVMRRDTVLGALRLAGVSQFVTSVSTAPPTRNDDLQLTEQRNPRTLNLDRQSVPALVDTLLAEEARVGPAIRRAKPEIVRAIRAAVRALKDGGRLFYVGAGTSGRLGVLDASECPPTFSTDPEQVQAIIAGGAAALTRAIEAAEDDAAAGATAVRFRGVGIRDVVVGIAASGRTPFVMGALDEARRRGARTFLLCFSPPPATRHAVIFIRTGPEALTGSTRLKAGTATKIVLNLLSTITMVRLGKVRSNLMVNMRPTNDKLQARACRIVAMLCGCDETEARQRLERVRWHIPRALPP